MNEKINLLHGPMMIVNWYEGNELCECKTPLKTRPTSDYKTHQNKCPLRDILEERLFKNYLRFYPQ